MEILRSKYKVRQDWLHKPPPKFASPIRRAIKGAKSIIVKGACYLIGGGASINIWQDPWVPWIQGFIPKPRIAPTAQTPLFVTQLIDHANYEWNIRLVHTTFEPESAQAILSIPLPARAKPDKLIWSPNRNGNFLVHSAYGMTSNQSSTHTNTEV